MIKAWPSDNKDIKDLKVTLSEKGKNQKTSFGPKPESDDDLALTISQEPEKELSLESIKIKANEKPTKKPKKIEHKT